MPPERRKYLKAFFDPDREDLKREFIKRVVDLDMTYSQRLIQLIVADIQAAKQGIDLVEFWNDRQAEEARRDKLRELVRGYRTELIEKGLTPDRLEAIANREVASTEEEEIIITVTRDRFPDCDR